MQQDRRAGLLPPGHKVEPECVVPALLTVGMGRDERSAELAEFGCVARLVDPDWKALTVGPEQIRRRP
jgi:hypothetical protein